MGVPAVPRRRLLGEARSPPGCDADACPTSVCCPGELRATTDGRRARRGDARRVVDTQLAPTSATLEPKTAAESTARVDRDAHSRRWQVLAVLCIPLLIVSLDNT